MTRRTWLETLVSGLGVLATGLRGLAAPPAAPVASTEAVGIALGKREVDTLLAFGEVIVQGRRLSPEERVDLVDHLARRVLDADRRGAYRTTAALLDQLAGRPFASLEIGDRSALVAHHRLQNRRVTGDQYLSEAVRVTRTTVVPDLIAAYWSSPAGWRAVGYQTFPGRCGSLTRYTRPDA